MSDESKLKPCPFCGGEPITRNGYVACECPAGSKLAWPSVKQWNRRAPGPATAKMLEFVQQFQDGKIHQAQLGAEVGRLRRVFLAEWNIETPNEGRGDE